MKTGHFEEECVRLLGSTSVFPLKEGTLKGTGAYIGMSAQFDVVRITYITQYMRLSPGLLERLPDEFRLAPLCRKPTLDGVFMYTAAPPHSQSAVGCPTTR